MRRPFKRPRRWIPAIGVVRCRGLASRVKQALMPAGYFRSSFLVRGQLWTTLAATPAALKTVCGLRKIVAAD
jgi:hypothetical protein